jgi:hypothetical protein
MDDDDRDMINRERINLYSYVEDKPVNMVDPTGLLGHNVGGPSKPKNTCPPGCTKQVINDIFNKLVTAKDETNQQFGWSWGLLVPTQWKNLKEHCDKWEQLFEANLRKKYGWNFPWGSPCIVDEGVVQLAWWVVAGHAAYKVVFCDGTTVYFDNGTGGNGSGVFYPGDLHTIGLHQSGPWWPKAQK